MQNSGRFAARRTGLAAATGDYVLFVDAGVTIVPGSIPFATQAATDGRRVWNAHTELQADGNPYALFWSTVSALAFGDYVDDPRDTSFGPDEFDRYPKGTTCFLAPRELLADAFDTFTSRYSDTRNANDDGPIIRSIAARERINIAPAFACVYSPRTTLKSFVKHALHRGVVFVDGHGRRESRFFPIVVAFFPVSATLAAVTMRRPLVLPLTLAAASGAALATGIARRRPSRELAPFALLTPVYAVAHGLGMWKGVALALSARLQARP
jgi:glycosyltransferase involved in cell wall biosynthesis